MLPTQAYNPIRLIIAGGGTGGHIFPAIAVAQAIQQLAPDSQILFVGASGKMEMEKVPQAGYAIKGLTIAGMNRSNILKNWNLPFKLIKSFFQVRSIFNQFKPNAVFVLSPVFPLPTVNPLTVRSALNVFAPVSKESPEISTRVLFLSNFKPCPILPGVGEVVVDMLVMVPVLPEPDLSRVVLLPQRVSHLRSR